MGFHKRGRGRGKGAGTGGSSTTPVQASIVLSDSDLDFSANVGDGESAYADVTITSGTGGNFTSVTVGSIVHTGGWTGITAAMINSNTIRITVTTGALTQAVYAGTVGVVAGNASNSPQTIAVTLTVDAAIVAPAPILELAWSTGDTLSMQEGLNASHPARWGVNIRNIGDAASSLENLVVFGEDGTGWTLNELAFTSTGARLTVTPGGSASASVAVAALPVGLNVKAITLECDGSVAVFYCPLDVTAAPSAPQLLFSPPSLAFTGQTLDGQVQHSLVTVTNGGSTSMVGTVGVSSDASWLVGTPSGTGDTQSIDVAASTGTLPAGTHSGTLTVTYPGASNSPATIGVTLSLGSVAPAQVSVSPSSVILNGQVGDGTTHVQVLTITNTGGGTLATITPSEPSSISWLTELQGGSGNSQTVTLTATTGVLTAGTYTGTVRLTATGASNSPVDIPVQFIVAPVTPATIVVFPAGNVIIQGVVGDATTHSRILSISNGTSGGATLATIVPSEPSAISWLTESQGGSGNAQTVTLVATTGVLAVGSYSGTVRLTASGASNSPVDITVIFQVQASTPNNWPSPQLASLPAGWTWDVAKGYPTGSCFNTLANYRQADDLAMPTFGGTVRNVTSQGTWNTAIAAAIDGDIINITAGTILTDCQLPKRAGWVEGTGGFVKIRTSAHASLPPYAYANGPDSFRAEDRVTMLDQPDMATIKTTTVHRSPLLFQQGAGGYWFEGIDIWADVVFAPTQQVLRINRYNGTTLQTATTNAQCPTSIVFDRCIVRSTNGHVISVWADNCRYVSFRHCYIQSGLMEQGGTEWKGFLFSSGEGWYEILGCEYAGFGIHLLVGGSIPDILGNHMSDGINMWNKCWSESNLDAYSEDVTNEGKNCWEHKNAFRWLHAFNDARYKGYNNAGQEYCLLAKASNNAGNSVDHAEVSDVNFWCNKLLYMNKGFLSFLDKFSGNGHANAPAVGSHKLECSWNLHVFDPTFHRSTGAGSSDTAASLQTGILINDSHGDGIDGVRITNNTFGNAHDFMQCRDSTKLVGGVLEPQNGWSNVVVKDNICHDAMSYTSEPGPVQATAGGRRNESQLINSIQLANIDFRSNWVKGPAFVSGWQTLASAPYLCGYLTSGNDTASFVDPAAFDFTLVGGSPAKSMGTDGNDPGYRQDYMLAMVGQVE